MLAAARDPAAAVRARVTRELGSRFAPEPHAALVAALDDASVEVRREAVAAVRETGAGVLVVAPALVRRLQDADPEVRAGAAAALGGADLEAAVAIPGLIAALGDEVSDVRAAAVDALRTLQAGTPDSVAALARTLRDEEESVSERAACALGALGPAARAAAPELVASLRASEPRTCLVDALLAVTGDPDSVAAMLRPSLEGPHRRKAAEMLARIERPEVAPLLEALTEPWPPDWTGHALRTCPALLLPDLVEALRDSRPALRRAALRALGQLPGQATEATAALIGATSDAEPEVRHQAVATLGWVTGDAPAIVARLRSLLEDPHAVIRSVAAGGLFRRGAGDDALLDAIEVGPDTARWLPLETLAQRFEARGAWARALRCHELDVTAGFPCGTGVPNFFRRRAVARARCLEALGEVDRALEAIWAEVEPESRPAPVDPDSVRAFVDLAARAGRLDDAHARIARLPWRARQECDRALAARNDGTARR